MRLKLNRWPLAAIFLFFCVSQVIYDVQCSVIIGNKQQNGRYRTRVARRIPSRARQLASVTTTTPSPPPPPVIEPLSTSLQTIVGRSNQFALDLMSKLTQSSPIKNVFFSPFSIFTGLATLKAAIESGSESDQELTKLLHLEDIPSNEIIHVGIRDMLHHILYESSKETTTNIKLVNSVLIDRSMKPNTNYTELIRTFYHGHLENIGFGSDGEFSLKWINHFVNWWTEGNIPKLLDSQPDPLTKLMLVNAIFFQGRWFETFDPKFTEKGMLFDGVPKATEVSMMRRRSQVLLNCDPSVDICAVELPYAGGSYSMLILIPKARNSTLESTLDNRLSLELIENLTKELEPRTLEFGFPKFTLESGLMDLKQIMESLGMKSVFNPDKAMMTQFGLAPKDLYLKDIKHKAVLKVAEDGTVAAGATLISIVNRQGAAQFHIDRPFYLMIRDTRADAILFMGRVVSLES